VRRGSEVGKTYSIARVPVVIGRGRKADVVIAERGSKPTLSRQHATIDLRGGAFYYLDHSTNGSRINGEAIARGEPVTLRDDDEITLGLDTMLVFRDLRPRPETPRPPVESDVECAPVLRDGGDLWTKLVSLSTLEIAWRRVAANGGAPGADGVRVEDFAAHLEENLTLLARALQRGDYEPLPFRTFEVPKASGGMRQLCIAAVRDRVIQAALVEVLTPLFEPLFLNKVSFAYRPNRSAHDALKRVDKLLKAGNVWILDADIKNFFPSVPHDQLLTFIRQRVKDERVMGLITRLLAAGATTAGIGLPQGAVTSPLFSNVFLHRFDQQMTNAKNQMVRYADDFLALAPSRDGAERALHDAQQSLAALRLRLNEAKTRVCHLSEGFVFLGYEFSPSGRRPSERALSALEEKVQRLAENAQSSHQSDSEAAERLRQTLRGFCNYFGVNVSNLMGSKSSDQSPVTSEQSPVVTQHATRNTQHVPPTFTEEDVARFLDLFRGREGVYGRQWVHPSGKLGYVPIRQPLTAAAVRTHLSGEITLAVYVMCQDNTVHFLCVDVDAKLHGVMDDARAEPVSAEGTHEVALRIKDTGNALGLPVYLEESGRKGRHCWTFFETPIPAAKVKRLGSLLVAKAAAGCKGVVCEVFPKQDRVSSEALGALLKLPLGLHQLTHRRCYFLDEDGSPLPDQADCLRRIRRAPIDVVDTALAKLSGRYVPRVDKDAPFPPRVQKMIDGCRLLQHLVRAAQETKWLNHTSRLTLAYTLGHLGEEGAQAVHQIIAHTSNYNPAITEKWLKRVEPGHPPLSCYRIRDWHADIFPSVGCVCPKDKARGRYPSPVWFALTPEECKPPVRLERSENPDPSGEEEGEAEKPPAPTEGIPDAPSADDVWEALAEELFEDVTEEGEESATD
jgi:group II intron reverse transcriptase/maturase